VGGNLALIRSRVDLSESSGVQTSTLRALQGQSPYVVNASIGYDNPDNGAYLTLLYNVYGRRIVEAGAFGQPDTYDLPVHTVDIVASVNLPEGFRAGLKVGNILNASTAQVMRDTETERIPRGWDIGLRLSWGL
jgi:outer membrane receptor protein involved in Fe transport